MRGGGAGNLWVGLGGLNGAVGVVAGALAAHRASDGALVDLAARYQILHAVALIVVGLLLRVGGGRWTRFAGTGFLVGIIGFCGSIYAHAATGNAAFARATPIGGTILILAWLCLAMAALLDRRQ